MNKAKLYAIYVSTLLEWNQKFNLTSITDPAEIKVKHFEDSLTILDAVDLKDQKVIDIGSGAGFPGIPLKIERPAIKLTLVEATRKKTEFLKHIINKLGAIDPQLSTIEVVWDRAEKLNRDPSYAGKFDVALARAVAKLDKLIDYALPFLKPGGIFIASKGPDIEKEIVTAKVKIKEVKKLKLSNGDERNLLVVQR